MLHFGVNLTPDPHTAARYMAPNQVVTYPELDEGFSDFPDLGGWFQAHHPELWIDPIAAQSPEEFSLALQNRITEDDRFGRRQRPFFLEWPTDYPVITQRFGANPQIYVRFGMPGHEGLDIRALTNTNVYSCAGGVVYRVHTNPDDHPYGIHIRIQHESGYKTVYGHLARSHVRVGDRVTARQVIGKANSTGASTGSHLHLTLKLQGATETGETPYPKDVIDPTPFMVWPQVSRTAKTAKSSSVWPPGRCLVGATGRVGGPLTDADFEAIQTARLEAVKISRAEPTSSLTRLRGLRPSMFVLVQLMAGSAQDTLSPERFVSAVKPDLDRFLHEGVRHFEIVSNPNLQSEGWRRSWSGGTQFSAWFRRVLAELRRVAPDARFGFPGLSPGEFVSGWREDWRRFLDEAEEAAVEADWIGVHCSWMSRDGLKDINGGRSYEEYRQRYPDSLLFITEFSNPSDTVNPEVKAQQYLKFLGGLRDQEGFGAAFAQAISAVSGYTQLVWRREGETSSHMAAAIGRRSF